MDFIEHFRWFHVTFIYQNPKRIENFLKLEEDMMQKDSRTRFRFRLLNLKQNDWSELFKEIKASGCFRLVVDIEAHLISTFLHYVKLNDCLFFFI